MDLKGEHRINLPQARVWQALNDPAILKASIPGCDELTKESDTNFKGKVSASVGPVRAKFSGEANLSEIDAPNGYTLTASGSGGAAGMAKGVAVVKLEADGTDTVLRYDVSAQVAGKLAQIGSRLVEMAARKMADEFFTNFVRQIEPVAAAEAPAIIAEIAASPEPTPQSMVPAPETSSPTPRRWLVWTVIVLIVLAAVAILATR
jgi:carbon monoxide dehydrogenase subunit G